jgi:hypothetical protein
MYIFACGGLDTDYINWAFAGIETFGIQNVGVTNGTNGSCQSGLGFYQDGVNSVSPGKASMWYTAAPPGLDIADFEIYSMAVGSGAEGTGYIAEFFWNAGTRRVMPGNNLILNTPLPANTTVFGWQLACNPSGATCPAVSSGDASMYVYDIGLTAGETGAPQVTEPGGSANLWNQGSRYVRGPNWTLSLDASDPSGVYAMAAAVDGVALDGAPPLCTASNGSTPNHLEWQQCDTPRQWAPTITMSGDGTQPVVVSASSSAGKLTTESGSINVDSVQPTIALSGPTDAPSSAGTQYITATATAGLSGVQGISCTLDGAQQWYPSASAKVPVVGVGVHDLSCASENNSYDTAGQANWSETKSWTLSIRQPSVSAVSFARIADKLRCRPARVRERIPAHWVTVHRRGKVIRVKRRSRIVERRVLRCHARVVVRRVCHDRHCKKQPVLVLPHTVHGRSQRTRFGGSATVSGWLGTSSGVALGEQPVEILTAVANGHNEWQPATTVMTSSSGTWTARLGPGPSRLVEAVYGGTATIEPAVSPPIHLVVPAKVRIHVSPRHVVWGSTIRISGQVLGGYIPSGSKLLRLRIGVAGVRETVGIPNVARNGAFRTTWKFAPGRGVVRYWFSISTLKEADYPFAPQSSRRVYVTVG